MKIKDCMCDSVVWSTPDTTVRDCARIMGEQHIGSMPVCNQNRNVVGFVTDRDILLRAVACDKDINTTKVSDIMSTNVCCCDVNHEIDQVTNLMSENQIRRVPVVDNNKIVGIVTLGDLAKNDGITYVCVGRTYENICNRNNRNAE